MLRVLVCTLLLMITSAASLQAQLREWGAPRSQSRTITAASGRTQAATAISLPFWDDFSTTPGDRPDTLWVNSETVMVNNGNAIHAPTLKVATFDGLKENGIPYTTSPADYLAFGITDSLISRPIRMADVNVLERNSVFLSFLYEWSGHGEAPDARDFLQLQFLDNTDTWITITTLQASADIKIDTFYQVRVRINQPEYYHNNFQFRLRSSGRKSGYYDTWNVDYFYLDKGRSEDPLAEYTDKAISSGIGPILRNNYYSAPVSHFHSDPLQNTINPTATFSHLYSVQQNSWNYSFFQTVEGRSKSNSTINENIDLGRIPVQDNQLKTFEVRTITAEQLPQLTTYTAFDSILSVTLRVRIDSGELNFPTYANRIPTIVNNSFSQSYEFSNYYAYDDGSAEGTAGLTSSGQIAVVRFPMLTTTQDTINGVNIYFAYHGQNAPSTVELQIYDNNNGIPGELIYSEIIPAQQQPLNTFLKHKLQQAIVVKDTFFLGWREFTAAKIARIGIDKNNDTGQQIYTNINGLDWVMNDRVTGSLMIRPVFGSGKTIITGIPEEEEPASLLAVYPNPSNGTFTIPAPASNIRVLNMAGNPVSIQTEQMAERSVVTLQQQSPGLYLVKFSCRGKEYTQKVMVR